MITDINPRRAAALRASIINSRGGYALSKTASDYLVQRLYDWGIRRVFGYPGDGINGVMWMLGNDGLVTISKCWKTNASERAARKVDVRGLCTADTSGTTWPGSWSERRPS